MEDDDDIKIPPMKILRTLTAVDKSVFDAMKARIAALESEVAKWKESNTLATLAGERVLALTRMSPDEQVRRLASLESALAKAEEALKWACVCYEDERCPACEAISALAAILRPAAQEKETKP